MVLPALTLALLSVPPPVPMPGDAEAQRFKAAFEKGEALYQQGEFGAAIWNFRVADRQRVTPEVAYDLAKCHEKLGDAAYTLYYYRLYMLRAPKAPDTLDVAEKVGEALAQAENDGRGYLELDAPRANGVTVNGVRYPEPPVAVFLPPGDYDVVAEFPFGPRTMSVSISGGKTTAVHFEPLQPPLVAMEQALSPEALAKGLDKAEPPKTKGLRIGSYVVLGAGVAAFAAGAAMGALSSGDAARAADKSLTVADAEAAAADANGKAVGANVLMSAGGAALAGGALMFVFSMPEPGLKSGGGGP